MQMRQFARNVNSVHVSSDSWIRQESGKVGSFIQNCSWQHSSKIFLSPCFSDGDIVDTTIIYPSICHTISSLTTGQNLTKLATWLSSIVKVCESNIIFLLIHPSVHHAISS